METTYVQHLHNLQELADVCQSNSDVPSLDLNICDVETLTCLVQQNEVNSNTIYCILLPIMILNYT